MSVNPVSGSPTPPPSVPSSSLGGRVSPCPSTSSATSKTAGMATALVGPDVNEIVKTHDAGSKKSPPHRVYRFGVPSTESEYRKSSRFSTSERIAKTAGCVLGTLALGALPLLFGDTWEKWNKATYWGDDTFKEYDRFIPDPKIPDQVKQAQELRIYGKHMDGIGYDPTVHDGSDLDLQSFIKRIEKNGKDRIWDDSHKNQCIVVGGKQGAFIFIPKGKDGKPDIKNAKSYNTFDGETGESFTEDDSIIAAFKIFSKNYAAIHDWCVDNNKHFYLYCFDNESGIVRGFSDLPFSPGAKLFRTSLFGYGYGTQIKVPKENIAHMGETMKNLNDPEKRRKERKTEHDRGKNDATEAEGPTTLRVTKDNPARGISGLSDFDFSPDGTEYNVRGDGNCAIYSAIAARKHAEGKDLRDDKVKQEILDEALDTRHTAVDWLNSHRGEPSTQKALATAISEEIPHVIAQKHRELYPILAANATASALPASALSLFQEIDDLSALQRSVSGVIEKDFTSLTPQEIKNFDDAINGYLAIINHDHVWCGYAVHYALGCLWGYKLLNCQRNHSFNPISDLYPKDYRPSKGSLHVINTGGHYIAMLDDPRSSIKPTIPVRAKANTDKLVDFYVNDKEGPKTNSGAPVTFQDVLNFTDKQLEEEHGYIQWLFPTKDGSHIHPDSPVLTPEIEQALHKENMKIGGAFRRMLRFYGLTYSDDRLSFVKGANWAERSKIWLTADNHNFKRITRILSSLKTLGYKVVAERFLDCLRAIYRENSLIIGDSIAYWESALGS